MSVHVGRITSDVTSIAEPDVAADPHTETEAPWQRHCRIQAVLDHLERDRHRTATGCCCD